ncbi:plexin-B-like [Ptychodera flava]|uniref:plexin-B-like n=1 Tax=Ptychodera flava TaxID=63121 RepID=UPI003969D26D
MDRTFLISHSFALFETIILFSIFALVQPSDANIYEFAIFTDVTSAGFNHLTVHNDTGDVYVGGVNQLYRLNADVELKANATTGPEYDDDEAYDTFNKILTINYAGDDELITCGGYQGVCQTRQIQGLTVTDSSPIFVVANKTNESTVGFVAPHYHLDQLMLYVGTTSTSTNPGSPLVSGRQLEGNQIFEVFGDYAGDPARVDVASSYITTFPVGYVAGFSYGRYSYFLTTQKSSTSSSGYISKLVRVCQQAEFQYFSSYAEVTLRCLDDSYNLAQAAYLTRPGQDLTQSLALDDDEEVLFVTFAVGEDDPPTPTTTSALCMYEMSVIETVFQDAAQGCMEGDGLQEFTAYWMLGASCSGSLPYSRGTHECYALTYYQYANGVDGQYGHAVEDYPDTLVTSIAVTTVEQHTVGFLGTDTGSILKLHLVNTSFANTFEVVDFEESQSQFLPDMMFDVTEEHLYRLSVKSVRKIKVEDCSQYTTCASCLRSLDPYCGWCLLDKRCSTYASCADSQPSSNWLHHFDDDVCVGIEIESIDPEDSIPINVAHPITLNMAGLPDDDDSISYTCNFNGYSTVADRDGQSLTCDTPPPGYRPHIPCDEDHITEILNVTDDTTNGDYSETDFHYYDCSVHKSCTSCVTSDWACNWCVYENRCTHYLDICQRDDSSSVVVGINNKFNDTGIKDRNFVLS